MKNKLVSHSSLRLKAENGFSLIELMITVAIIGILASIAYPSYVEQVSASRRTDAVRAVLEGVQFMKRYYSANDTFVGAALPSSIKTPLEGAATYTISIASQDASSFKITATRTGTMASDKCGDLSVTQSGAATTANNTANLEDCFKGL